MAFVEVEFKSIVASPRTKEGEVVLSCTGKKHYLRFNQFLTKELIDKSFKFATLEHDPETNELRIKFRKFSDANTVAVGTNGKKNNLMITHQKFVDFIKDKLNVGDEKITLSIGDDRSNVATVQTRYISRQWTK
jgi:hypothetical protein